MSAWLLLVFLSCTDCATSVNVYIAGMYPAKQACEDGKRHLSNRELIAATCVELRSR